MFSRASPSPLYQEPLRQDRQLHPEGNPAQKLSAEGSFTRKSLIRRLPRIRNLVRTTKGSSLLDHGCGKGLQYLGSLARARRGPAGDPEYFEVRLSGSPKAGS